MSNQIRSARVLSMTLALVGAVAAIVVAQCSTNGTTGWTCYKIATATNDPDKVYPAFMTDCGSNANCTRYPTTTNYPCDGGTPGTAYAYTWSFANRQVSPNWATI